MSRAGIVLLTVVCVLAAEALIALWIAWSGIIDVAATRKHSPLVAWFLETTQASSIERHSRELEPPALDDPDMREAGLVHYHEMCVPCHGAPGIQPSEVGKGLNPGPPDLSDELHPPRGNFWTMKHGIRMTGMPAFGPTHDDEELWAITAFLEELPKLDAEAYAARVRRAGLRLEPAGHEHETTPGHAPPEGAAGGEAPGGHTDGAGAPHEGHAH